VSQVFLTSNMTGESGAIASPLTGESSVWSSVAGAMTLSQAF